MKRLFIGAILAFSACTPAGYLAAPSGQYLDGVPKDAVVIVSTESNRAYKFEGCLVKQQFHSKWETYSIEC